MRSSLIALALLLPTLASARIEVVATLPDLAALAAEVAGDRAHVTCIARHSENPHYVDPRPSLLLPLSKADLLIQNGGDLEQGWLPPLLVNSRNARIQPGRAGHFVAWSHVKHLLEVPKGPVDRAQGDIHGGGNPHFTFDPRAAADIVVALGTRLGTVDPEGAAYYAERAAKTSAELRAFAVEQAARFRALPDSKRRLVAYHKSMVYLFDWLGLTAVTHVEPLPGVAPSPGHVVQVMQTMKTTGARLLVQESFYPRKTSQQLSKLVSGALLVLPAATAFDHNETYLHHLKHVTDELHAALAR